MNKEQKATDLATADGAELTTYVVPSNALAKDDYDTDGVQLQFERIKIPSGGGIAFEIADEKGETQPTKTFEAVIVYHNRTRAFYVNPEPSDGERPDCGSMDGIMGMDKDAVCTSCDECPRNKFGSATKGKGKACKEKRRLFVLFPGEMLPRIIALPTGSLTSFSKYVTNLLQRGKATNKVITKFALKQETNADGIKYSTVTLQVVRDLSAAEQASVSSMTETCKKLSGKVDAVEAVVE